MQVLVRDNNVDQALRALKKKLQREGVFREMKLRGHYREALREAGPREGGGRPPGPEADPQEAAARRAPAPAKPRPVPAAGGPGPRPAMAR